MSKTSRRSLVFLMVSLLSLSFIFSACAAIKREPSGQPESLTATFKGQDGGSYAGRLCSSGTAADNVHIHLAGLRTESQPISYRVEDFTGGGLWATPCDPVSNWFLYAELVVNGETNLYFKPFRNAPDGTEYKITVGYQDGGSEETIVRGTRVKP
jgi:hypothetical protein